MNTRPSARASVRAKLALVIVSLLVGILIFEAAGRFILNPADYLSITTRPDPVLGMTIEPNVAGFDEWGFRNTQVPKAADIVAIGDSHTFGNTAKISEAWPAVVARETSITVYNMGLGGYGPNQYYQLLATRALSLRPKQILVGFYMGDDFENAFSITYGLDHWTFLRDGRRARVNADIWGDNEAPGFLRSVRNWLSRYSLAYRLLIHGALSELKAKLQVRQAIATESSTIAVLDSSEDNIFEAFRPIRVAAGLDQERPEVREGMRIAFHLLQEMNLLCRKNECALSVIIIPSKETVFAEYLQRKHNLHLKTVVDSLIRNEQVATTKLKAFLEENQIPYLETLPALRREVQHQLYYRGPADMHPSANGYRVIGKAVADFLRSARLPQPLN